VNNEYVIRGNSALLKCSIPSFVADFVSVVSWQDNEGETYLSVYANNSGAPQSANGSSENLNPKPPKFPIIPPRIFISRFSARPTVVNQFYGADILMEYVIRGNPAILKCQIPSFVADFVHVESWIDQDGNVLKANDSYGWFSCIPKPKKPTPRIPSSDRHSQ
jgi:hypothetical protein